MEVRNCGYRSSGKASPLSSQESVYEQVTNLDQKSNMFRNFIPVFKLNNLLLLPQLSSHPHLGQRPTTQAKLSLSVVTSCSSLHALPHIIHLCLILFLSFGSSSFYFPCGLQTNEFLVILLTGFLNVCLIQCQGFQLTSSHNGVCLVLSINSTLVILK